VFQHLPTLGAKQANNVAGITIFADNDRTRSISALNNTSDPSQFLRYCFDPSAINNGEADLKRMSKTLTRI
jgi:recombinational DNA repair protein RecR